MASVGPNSPSASGSDGTQTAWANEANILASDNVYATCTTVAAKTNRLYAYTFGFAIPTGANIDNVTWEVEAKTASGSRTMRSFLERDAPGHINVVNTQTIAWTTTEQYLSFSVNNPTITPDEVNGANFGVSVDNNFTNNTDTFYVDHIRITVTYTPFAGGPSIKVTRQAVMRAATR